MAVTDHDTLRLILWTVLVAPCLVVTAYATVRAAAFAYYRTKLNHFKTIMKEIKEDDNA